MNHGTGNTHPIVHHPNRDTATESMLLNSSRGTVWDFLMAQIQTQLRNMSPDACFVHVRELQEMAHSELLLSQSDDYLNGMSPLPLVGRQHHRHHASTGYRNNQVSSISSPIMQQQPAVGSTSTAGLALFSPMARGLTTSPSQSRAPPSSNAAETEAELDEVSSSPSKMMLMTATNDDGLEDNSSNTNEDPVTSSVGLKLHRNKDSSSVRQLPNIQKKKDTLSPTTTPLPPKKKISSAKKKSATKSSPAKGGPSNVKKGFALPRKQASIVKKTRVKAKKKTPSQSRTGVENPTEADVLCGRGFAANNHKGNMQFRDYVMQLRCVYHQSQKGDKKAVAEVSLYIHL